jgi:hypothetical protein
MENEAEMGKLPFLTLRAVLVAGLAGSLFTQTVMMYLIARDLEDSGLAARTVPIIVVLVLGILSAQVVMVCVWRLLDMVRHGTVFSPDAFRYVDVVIGAITAAAVLTFSLGALLAPGEQVAPGVVLLIGGAGVMVAGVALLVYVLRLLLTKAISRDAEAAQLQAELDSVI